jgi:nicotinamidase-related amidase
MTDPRTVLLVVDPLKRFTEEGAPFEARDAAATVERINEAAGRAREHGHHVVWTTRLVRPQVGPGARTASRYGDVVDAFSGRWAELDDRLHIHADDVIIEKTRHSAFHATDLEQVLRTWGIRRVVIAGFTFNVCCLATAFDAVALDHEVVFATDLLGTRGTTFEGRELSGEQVHEMTQALVAYAIGEVQVSGSIFAGAQAV